MTSSPIKNHGFWGVLSNRGWDYWGYGKANNKPSQNHQPYEVEYWDILRFLSLGLDTIGFTIGLFFQAPVGCLRMLMDLRHVPWRRSLGHQARAFSLTSSSCVNVIIKPHWGNTWETVWYNYIYYIIIYISKQIYIYGKSRILLWSDPQVNHMQYDHSGGPVSAANLSLRLNGLQLCMQALLCLSQFMEV